MRDNRRQETEEGKGRAEGRNQDSELRNQNGLCWGWVRQGSLSLDFYENPDPVDPDDRSLATCLLDIAFIILLLFFFIKCTDCQAAVSFAGGTSLTTSEMKPDQTYLNVNWDFNDIWMTYEGKDYSPLAMGTASM